MRPESPELLEDVRDAAAFVLEVTGDRTESEYIDDRLLRQAVERTLP